MSGLMEQPGGGCRRECFLRKKDAGALCRFVDVTGGRVNRARDCFIKLAGTTGLEPAASAVTGQRSNQLNYVPASWSAGSGSRIHRVARLLAQHQRRSPSVTDAHPWWAVQDSNLRPPACKAGALTS